MVSEVERRRLVELYKDEPFHRAAAVVKSAVCLVALAGVALVGAEGGDPGAKALLQAQRHDSAANAPANASRAVYQERRAHYEERQTALAQRSVPRDKDASRRAADGLGFKHTSAAR